MVSAVRVRSLVMISCLTSATSFIIGGGGLLARGSRQAVSRRRCRSPFMCMADAAGGMGEEVDPDDVVDEDAVGVAKMRASEIKAELDMRGIDYKGIFEKDELVSKLIEARSLGKADPSLIDDFIKDNLERKMDPQRAEEFQQDLLDEEKLKDLTAADGTLPGGLTPEQMQKFATNPDVMVLMQNPKMQELMKKVMAGGPDAMAGLQNDPETMELLKKLNEAMASVKQ